MTSTAESKGRVAQRRRTRRAIVDATMSLLAKGLDPSINDIAAAADVSRRTVYVHFPTLDQLMLDATVGLMNVDVDATLEQVTSDDAHERLRVLVDALHRTMEESLPLGRRLIRLTVTAPPPADDQPRRGHRRIGWIEWAVGPLRETMTPRQFDDLVSTLAVVIGWESFIVLSDVRALRPAAVRDLTLRSALALLDAALASDRGADRG